MKTIEGSMTIREVLEQCPSARAIFDRHGLKGCGAEHGPTESLAFFARVHQVDAEELLGELNAALEHPSPEQYVYRESLADYIYRRFFKAGIAIVLTIGAAWGAVNLLQIALRRELLQPDLTASIHAHAHAMIFGWVGLFVMGFAYQSFPRFKYTTLWRPDLANLSFFLMLAGIGARVAAEVLQPRPTGIVLGLGGSVSELAAISLFLTIILKTARQSTEPRSPYEIFMLAAFAWLAIQALFSDAFFFAKATATTQEQLFWRIALLDRPLRDVQLLGFAVLIIAGVSQRFVPAVYGLARTGHNFSKLIFWLINLSLLLDVGAYVGWFLSRGAVWSVLLELAYSLMAVWAALLVAQLGIFLKPSDKDRSWKFIRAAYVWLIVAIAMLPLSPFYDRWTGQIFSHAYWGAHRHAFTVGFVSMMIVGVASRVVPILAGVDAKGLDSLWGPFILLNVGCAGRALLQVLTDFAPAFAYRFIGLTGILEVTALAWWGIGLWRLMNVAQVRRPQMLQAAAASVHR